MPADERSGRGPAAARTLLGLVLLAGCAGRPPAVVEAVPDPITAVPSTTAASTAATPVPVPSVPAPRMTAPRITIASVPVPPASVPSVPVPSTTAPSATVTSSAVPEATATTAVGSSPVRLRIPVIGVDTGLMTLGLLPDGSLEVPPDGTTAGWFDGSPAPGEPGPAVLAGHADWEGAEGVFHAVGTLRPGDEVSVDREDGSALRFTVTQVAQFPKDRFPTEDVYGDVDTPQLRLITCGGEVDPTADSYRDNIVVYAESADPDQDEPVR